MKGLALLLLLLVTGAGHCPAQDRIITVNPKVGPEIDSSECATYGILTQFTGMRKAIIYQSPDSTYRMVVTLADPAGRDRDSLVAVTASFLHVLFSKIEYREALKSGTVPSVVASSPFMNQQQPGELPFGTGPSLFNEYPRLGFSVGISTFKPEIVGFENVVESILDGYRAQGYDMAGSSKTATLEMPLLAPVFGLSGAFTPEWQAEIQASVPSGGNVGIWFASLGATYTPEFLTSSVVRLGFAAGLFRLTHEFSTTFGFEKSTNRISPVDSLGRYAYLSTVTVNGSGTQWGGTLSLLGELHDNRFSLVTAFVQYTIAPTYVSDLTLSGYTAQLPITQSDLGQYEFHLQGFSAGAKLTIHF